MNLLLSLNKKYVLLITVVLFIVLISFFFFKFFNSIENNLINNKIEITNADITEPRFAINSPTQKIYITAKEGNFIGNGKILLRKDVTFKSNNFSITSDNVTFDRKQQTAQSNNNSIFKSEKTTISSEGFDIYDNGNKIKFYGSAIVILK